MGPISDYMILPNY